MIGRNQRWNINQNVKDITKQKALSVTTVHVYRNKFWSPFNKDENPKLPVTAKARFFFFALYTTRRHLSRILYLLNSLIQRSSDLIWSLSLSMFFIFSLMASLKLPVITKLHPFKPFSVVIHRECLHSLTLQRIDKRKLYIIIIKENWTIFIESWNGLGWMGP